MAGRPKGTAREHGTRAKYVMEKCHCEPCREANRVYAASRARSVRWGDAPLPPAYVDATEAKNHLRWLARRSVGTRAVADRTGIARSVLCRIKSGDIGRCRPDTIEKILLTFPIDALPSAVIPAEPTWRLLDDLIAHGFTRTFLARELGSRAKVPALQVAHDYVLVSTARNVKALHGRLMVRTIAGRQQSSALRARYRKQEAA